MTDREQTRRDAQKVKPFDSVKPKPPPPICGVVIGSSWHEPIACAYPPDHAGPHSWASIPALPGRTTKREAAARLAIIAAEIRLAISDSDDDAPTWADDLGQIADALDSSPWTP